MGIQALIEQEKKSFRQGKPQEPRKIKRKLRKYRRKY
jgi:hypothetical protein